MLRLILFGIGLSITFICIGQKRWDGGGNNTQWSNDLNWFPDGIPLASDDVLLDNSLFPGSYLVELPSGNSLIDIHSLTIGTGPNNITLLLPVTNIATTALTLSGTGDVIVIGKNGVLRNASGAASGTPVLLNGSMKILDGGRYIHQTARGNAALIDKLSTAPGTEKGIFEFDVPGTAGYTVSLTSNTFGTLSFSATTAGGTKSYSGSGTGNLNIRGDLIIGSGAQLSSTLTADILLAGNLQADGRLNIIPVTAGSTGRSLKFLGENAFFSGNGQVTMNANFRVMEITAGAKLTLNRNCILANPANAVINYGALDAGTFIISGSGKFAQADLATLIIGAPAGLQSTGDSGNVQTAIREFSKKSAYIFQGSVTQRSGSGLPDTVSALGIRNAQGIYLTQQVYCVDSLLLTDGQIFTSGSRLLIFSGRIIRSPVNDYGLVNAGWKNSFVSGPMDIDADDTGNLIIPLGADNIYAPLMIHKIMPGKLRFAANYYPERPVDTTCHPPLEFISRNEYWSITTNDSGFYGGFIDVSIRPQSVPAGNVYTLLPAIFELNGSNKTWDPSPGRITMINSYGWVKMDSLASGFNDLTIGFALPAQPLAWQLLNFTAGPDGKSVKLQWEADEDNELLVYTPEKSRDGIHFKGFDTIPSSGKHIARYKLTDDAPFPQISYYRLSVASGNHIQHSEAKKVWMKIDQVRLYPNPASDMICIYFPDISSRYELSIVNILGLTVYKTFVNTVTCQIRVSNLRNGVYFVMLRHNNELITLPFTKF
jgi:hypothetical protein